MRGKQPFYFLVFAFAPLLFVLQAPERAETFHQISLTVLKPFLTASHALSSALEKTSQSLTQFWNLYQKHGELVERVEELEGQLVGMGELQKENERLKKLLDFKKEIPSKTIPARVIGRDLVPWRKTILIDKGFSAGVKKRMAVVNAQGLIGRIVEAGPYSARAVLLLDPQSRVGVLFQESRDLAVAEGDGSSLLRVTHIDRESAVKVGDRVVSSGMGEVYPKGIPLGTIEMVSTEKGSLELVATVRSFVDFSKLEEVLCVTSSPAGS